MEVLHLFLQNSCCVMSSTTSKCCSWVGPDDPPCFYLALGPSGPLTSQQVKLDQVGRKSLANGIVHFV